MRWCILTIHQRKFISSCNKQTFTCSKSTTETLEEVWDIFKVNNKDTRTIPLTSFWCLSYQPWTYITPLSSVSIVKLWKGKYLQGRNREMKWLGGFFLSVMSNEHFLALNPVFWPKIKLPLPFQSNQYKFNQFISCRS